MSRKKYSTLEYVLISLIPYSRPNMLLSFKPHEYFNELERISRAKRSTLQSTLARAQNKGLVQRHKGVPRLTAEGKIRVRPYTAQILNKDVVLMVIFDIPEEIKYRRRQFRRLLRQLDFNQTQKSVWTTRFDYRKEVIEAAKILGIREYVQIFESARISL